MQDATVTVTAEDRPDIAARVSTAGWKIGNNGVRVVENLAGNRLELEILVPELNFAFARHAVHVDLKVPRAIDLQLKTGMGGVTIGGVHGTTLLNARAGVVNLLDVDGKLDVSTGQGKIRARGRFDLLTVRSGLGAIDIEAAPGSRMFAAWRITTEGGSVTLRLPPDFAADLDAQTDAGHIAIDLPYTVTASPEQSSTRGKINAGEKIWCCAPVAAISECCPNRAAWAGSAKKRRPRPNGSVASCTVACT